MDKEKFGEFVATIRKERSMTQKDLADKLLISDKAVSKWERGLSYPDITLLEPLANILSLSITELIECREIDMSEKIEFKDAENLLKGTLELNEAEKVQVEKERKFDRIIISLFMTLLSVGMSVAVMLLVPDAGRTANVLLTPEALMLFFGLYFWLLTKDTLPIYYDENKISIYSDGFLHMNMPGVYFNNSNWKHIVKGVRMWSVVGTMVYPPIIFLEEMLFPLPYAVMFAVIFIAVFSIFIPIYYNAKKYK